MTLCQELAKFVVKVSYDDLSPQAKEELKKRLLDSLGCAIGALKGKPIQMLKSVIEEFGGHPLCTMLGGGRTSPDRAAFFNSALIRYLDFNDSYLAKGETCHPSDNIAPVLTAAEYAHRSGKDLLTAIAVAYQVQCRLSDVAPVRNKGFDHTTQGAYGVASGVAKALGLDEVQTANAIAISGTAFNALRVTRTGSLSHWKGLASPNTAFCVTNAAFLAKHGITGPLEVFEGNKGFMDAIAGRFEIEWKRENLEKVTQTILKKYNAEIHSQSAIEGILELKSEYNINHKEIEKIEIEIFDVAYNIIGGGEEGNKWGVKTKEEADHSLPYLVAVAIIDGRVMPEQFRQKRILNKDVQELHKKVFVKPEKNFSKRFPHEMPCSQTIYLKNGNKVQKYKNDYEGFLTKPMPWEKLEEKFKTLTKKFIDNKLQKELIDTVKNIEHINVSEFTRIFAIIGSKKRRT